MANFTYGEWRLIGFAIIAIFCAIAGFTSGEGVAVLLWIPVGACLLYLAYRKSRPS
jgi:hypothetical protein